MTHNSTPHHTSSYIIQELTQSDDDVNLGHLGLALTGYCKVAALYMRKLEGMEDLNDEQYLKPDISPLEVANLIFDGNPILQFLSLKSYFVWFIFFNV
jgi:hypothetical protein